MRTNFVAPRQHRFYEPRIPISHPPHDEEGGAHLDGVKQIEEGPSRLFHARRQPIPILRRERPAHAADVKPLFQIDREDVARVGRHSHLSTANLRELRRGFWPARS